jgi:hypothetical protein
MNNINVYEFDNSDLIREILIDEISEVESVKFE